ncbi:MAG: hypothetical protein QGF57_05695 [Candidatus Marinimicrobia bacterium]|nr:hypothetical protein [Candidatus Neomarinimicrobiota bacterium]
MIFQRNELFTRFPWLQEKNLPMIISADYDGLICAAFLHHFFNWKLEGFYDLTNIWVSKQAMNNKKNLVWVDLNILPKQGKAIGGHIISLSGEVPNGFQSSCNPNILNGITAGDFHKKFPFSTVIYLLWLHNVSIKKELIAKQLLLHSDATWLKFQHYPKNCKEWQTHLTDYDWDWLFRGVKSKSFEKRIDDQLYPILRSLGAISGNSKLNSSKLKIQSRQFQFNPDWDMDVVLNLFTLFGKHLEWTPPAVPDQLTFIPGRRYKLPLAAIKEKGLQKFLNERKVFSYAIPSPRIFNFTTFGDAHKSPLDK